MRIRFLLSINHAIVEGKSYDKIIFEWFEECDAEYILRVSKKWINTERLLIDSMTGLERVGSADLEIEPETSL